MEGLLKSMGLNVVKGLFIEKGLLKNPYSFPAIIEDGNTVAWYLSDELSTITKDGSDLVSVWADKLGSGNDLTTLDNPTWVENEGILFDGIGNYMQALFTFVQPEQIYIVLKQVDWVNLEYIADGGLFNTGYIRQFGSTPNIIAHAGTNSAENSDLAINTFGIVRVLFNGASSMLVVNENTPIIGNFGALNMGGLTIGARANFTNSAHIQVKEIILRKIADSAQDQQDIYNYLANKYSI